MHEFNTTRSNPLIDPVLSIWGWEIPVYLFLGGMVAGFMVLSGYLLARRRHEQDGSIYSLLPLLSLLLLTLGMIALFLDLEHKLYVWRMYVTFQIKSPMSWGAWILIVVYPALAVAALVRPHPWLQKNRRFQRMVQRFPVPERWWNTVALVNIILGVLLGIYTGILLSALGARPLWNSAILGPLFLASGLSSAAAFIHMAARRVDEREFFARTDNKILAVELFILFLFLIGLATSARPHMEAAAMLVGGSYAPFFWVFVVTLGIVLPLILQSLAVRHHIRHSSVVPIAVMAGGLALRFVIVNAGQVSHWTRTALH